jgi:hypothetical protein
VAVALSPRRWPRPNRPTSTRSSAGLRRRGRRPCAGRSGGRGGAQL